MGRKRKEDSEEQQPDDNLISKLAKDLGGDLLSELGKTRGFIDTGNIAVNFILSGKFCGGGVPRGTLAEVYGESSSGKSLFGTNLLKGVQAAGGLAIYLDAERAINADFAVKASKVDSESLVVIPPITLEKAFNKINTIIHKVRGIEKYDGKPLVIVYDSIAASPCDDEFAETTVDMENATQAEKNRAGVKNEQPGKRARICSRELRKLMPVVEKNDTTVLFVNQLRMLIGIVYGANKTTAGGGESLKYYCSSRLALSSQKKIVEEDTKRISGVQTTFRNMKSRFTPPHQSATEVDILFSDGIDPFGGLMILLIQSRRITKTGPGRYQVAEPWAGGKEIKFQAAQERNKIPLEVLYECPKLVDAKDTSELDYYLTLFDNYRTVDYQDLQEEDQ